MSSLAMMCPVKSPGVLTIVPTLRSFSSTSSDEIDLGSRYASGIGIIIGAGDEGRQVVAVIMWPRQCIDRRNIACGMSISS